MSNDIDLKQLEKKAYLSYHQDGLIDICAGLILIGFGIAMAYDLAWMIGIWIVTGLPVYASMKKAITIPRLGFVKFKLKKEEEEKKKKMILFSIMTIVGSLFFIFTLIIMNDMLPSWINDMIKEYYLVILGATGASFFAMAAYMFELKRFYLYSLTVLAIFIIQHIIDIEPYWAMIISGFIITLTGLFIMVRFIQKYPIQKDIEFKRES
ncbi:hypothetical protein CUJ83_12690 [Methanocella sp. CWC-04]|uniref:Uncharacterized protein n=1 Tax=Methanooceanicella nereidis TaxID=2052831 RepID=A0AAP2REJ2_9EURY|nr:hypothetical protein [Methanocella sp. CWC-04]MCD1295853.1 hypothetical protein [Methanocella sp. CWC-04]